jgi:hypothetical protein
MRGLVRVAEPAQHRGLWAAGAPAGLEILSDLTDSVEIPQGPPAWAAFAPPPLPPPLPRLQSQNYLARHWRGELSLPVSYWLNGVLGGIAIGVLIAAFGIVIARQDDAKPMLWLAALVAIWLCVLVFTAWQAVGVWRSATRYKRGGRSFWGGAAKTMVVIGAVQSAASFATVGAPQLAGIFEIVTGDTKVGPHQFHVLANGQMLEFSGGITFGVAQEMQGFLDAMSGVKTVRLNSIGGRILEAQKMSDMIKTRGLSTLVVQDCLSACTIVFLGGKERYLLSAARLGFHQPAFRGMTTAARLGTIAHEVERLQRFGLSKAFAERANDATPSGMWYPDKDELLREHVVTKVIAPNPAGKPAASK